MRKGTRWAGILLLAPLLVGCSGLVRPVTGEAVGAALDAANDEVNRRKLEALLTSEAVERSIRELTVAAVRSALDEVSTPEREARKRQAAEDFVRGIGPVIEEMLGKAVLPRVEADLSQGVRNALDQALGPAGQERAGAFAAAVARRTLGEVGPQVTGAISDGVARGLERSVRAVLARDLSPAIDASLDAHGPAIARTLRAGTAASLLGVADAMQGPFGEMIRSERRQGLAEAAAAVAKEREAWLREIRGEVAESQRWFRSFVLVAAVTVVLLVASALLLWELLRARRRLRGEA